MKPAPVHLWNPPYCGEIDLIIKSDGTWVHEGAVIRRQKLIELFSSILTLGSDREFYLVSPHEKVRIKVEHHPFVIQKIDVEGEGSRQTVLLTTNVGETVAVGKGHLVEISLKSEFETTAPTIHIRNGLDALIDRKTFYRLVEIGQHKKHDNEDWFGIESASSFFPIIKSKDLDNSV